MKSINLACLLLAIATTTGLAPAAPVPAEQRPNVLFIVVDDLNNRLGCYGDPVVKTPNLDHLAARGMRFDRAYCQYPVCNPSRASFLSGLRPDTSGVLDQQTKIRSNHPDVVMLPEHFRNHGYFTAGVGKVEHLNRHSITWDFYDDAKGRVVGGPYRDEPGRLLYEISRQTDDDDPETHDTNVANRVINLLENREDKPFFIVAGIHKPHVPHVAPKKYFDLYDLTNMPVIEVPANHADGIPRMAIASPRSYQPEMSEQRRRNIIRNYYACISYLDAEVGRMLDTLARLGLNDNTIVVFFSDHGFHLGEHHWWAKASLFEPSARVPLIMAGPGISTGSCERVVELIDLYPTLAELARLPAPPQGQGTSFAPLLSNPTQLWDKAAYTGFGPLNRGRSVRTERYRYTEWNFGKDGVELYDYETDPHEHTNLANSPDHAQVVAQMRALLRSVIPATDQQ